MNSPRRSAALFLVLALAACSPSSDPVARAKNALKEGDPQEAFRAAREAVRANPDDATAQELVARACYRTLRTTPGARSAARAVL